MKTYSALIQTGAKQTEVITINANNLRDARNLASNEGRLIAIAVNTKIYF